MQVVRSLKLFLRQYKRHPILKPMLCNSGEKFTYDKNINLRQDVKHKKYYIYDERN